MKRRLQFRQCNGRQRSVQAKSAAGRPSGGPMIRILFPPAGSLVRTGFPPFMSRKSGVHGGVSDRRRQAVDRAAWNHRSALFSLPMGGRSFEDPFFKQIYIRRRGGSDGATRRLMALWRRNSAPHLRPRAMSVKPWPGISSR
jgi:hypothetical protein